MKNLFTQSSVLAASILLFSCSSNQSKNESSLADPLAAHIDSLVKPGDDFFLFANGKWFKQNPIPASEGSNGLWLMVGDTINAQIRQICEISAGLKNEKKGSNKQKIGDFFYTGMDSLSLNKNGLTDIKIELDKIEKVKNLKDLIKSTAYINSIAGSPIFNFGISQDLKLSNKYAIILSQGGLSLPDRRYYFDKDSQAIVIRKKFLEYAILLFKQIGYNDSESKKAATNLMKLESDIAKTSKKLEDTRDPYKNYNKLSEKQLLDLTSNIDWKIFFKESGLKNVDTVIVAQTEFFQALNDYLKTYPVREWKNYLKFHLFNDLANYADDVTYNEYFDFNVKTLWGVKQPKPRWKRVVEQTDYSLGELIGQVYVKEYLPKGTKEKLLEIGNGIKEVYAERIAKLDWMSDSTKKKAIKKLNKIIMKIGYPDKWKDMGNLQIDRSSYVRNVIRANRWYFQYVISKFGKPVDRKEWEMEPQTYNAYYTFSNNDITIPGCNIIIPGFEHKLADDALLYSIIGGSTFGHEITHGFDDQGSKFNEFGNLSNWWTKEDSIKFLAKTRMIVNQFNKYIAVNDLHINGEQTQGENIADLGGVIMGYEAFKKTKQYKNNEIIAGLNPDQRYFLGYAFAWMVNDRPEVIDHQVRSDFHCPAKYRVIGPLSNMPEFLTTFNIRKGEAMWRSDTTRVQIW